MHEKTYKEYFYYQSPSLLRKDLYEENQILYEENQIKNEKIVKYINDSLIDLRNPVNSNKIPDNENPNRTIDIVEKMLIFNKQQKSKGLKILAPKQMLQRLPIGLAQVKTGNTSENFLNEIQQIIYSKEKYWVWYDNINNFE